MRFLTFALVASLPFAAEAAGPITPGLWENTSTITSMDASGMPSGMAAAMKSPHTIRHCVTPEDAARGPQEAIKHDSKCQTKNYTLAGGVFRIDMSCPNMTMHSEGRFTPTSYSSTGTMTTSSPRGGMKMSFAGSGKRLGPWSK
jgi:hypothetical protein